MSATDDILNAIDLNQMATYLGVDEATAEAAVQQAVPALLHGLEGEAADPEAATGLTNALAAHNNGLVGSGEPVDPHQIDTEDGTKIVAHIFGNQPQATSNANALLGGLGSGLVKKLLPILAPMVMSWLANQLLNHPTVQNQAQTQSSNASGGGLGDVLGGILGSVLGGGQQAQQAPQTQQSSGGLGDILNSVLGGASGGGGLGSILGSILGSGGAPQVQQAPQTQQYQQPSFGQGNTSSTGKIQIQADDPGATQQQSSGSSDVLGSILGSILGR